jgi:hypothetical protein
MESALKRTPAAPGKLDTQLYELKQELFAIDEKMNGNASKKQVGEKTNPTSLSRHELASFGTMYSTYGPTETLKHSLQIAGAQFDELKKELDNVLNIKLPAIEKALMDAGAPWIIGQPIPKF